MSNKPYVVVPVEWLEKLKKIADKLDYEDHRQYGTQSQLIGYIDSVDEILKQERVEG